MQSPYTYTGDIYIAINSYRCISHLYDRNFHRKYLKHPKTNLTSVQAYEHMKMTRRNQNILISGKLGAGKLETAKHLIGNLMHICHKVPTESGSVIDKIVATNALLETFGNSKLSAMTIENFLCFKIVVIGGDSYAVPLSTEQSISCMYWCLEQSYIF